MSKRDLDIILVQETGSNFLRSAMAKISIPTRAATTGNPERMMGIGGLFKTDCMFLLLFYPGYCSLAHIMLTQEIYLAVLNATIPSF